MKNKIWYSIAIVILLSSCGSHRPIAYLQNVKDQEQVNVADSLVVPATLQTGDILQISMTSMNPDADAYFKVGDNAGDVDFAPNSFIVKSSGNIELPLVGQLHVVGCTLDSVENLLKSKLTKYLKEPTVNVRLVNFKITVMGEVNSPGVFNFPNAQVSLFQALGMAGDLTIYGMRTNVLVIRQTSKGYQYLRYNLNDPNLPQKKDLSLQNNDIVYVQPSKGKLSTENNVYRIVPIVISSITLVALMYNIIK